MAVTFVEFKAKLHIYEKATGMRFHFDVLVCVLHRRPARCGTGENNEAVPAV